MHKQLTEVKPENELVFERQSDEKIKVTLQIEFLVDALRDIENHPLANCYNNEKHLSLQSHIFHKIWEALSYNYDGGCGSIERGSLVNFESSESLKNQYTEYVEEFLDIKEESEKQAKEKRRAELQKELDSLK